MQPINRRRSSINHEKKENHHHYCHQHQSHHNHNHNHHHHHHHHSSRRRKRWASCHTDDEETVTRKNNVKRFDDPIHQKEDSLLTSASGYSNLRGFFNLCIILLCMSTGRLVLENLIKYGLLVESNAIIYFIALSTFKENLFIIIILLLSILHAYLIEKMRLTIGRKQWRFIRLLHIINLTMLLIFPPYIVLINDFHVLSAITELMWITIVFLKLWSYAAINSRCYDWLMENEHGRRKTKHHVINTSESMTNMKESFSDSNELDSLSSLTDNENEVEEMEYPKNINLKNLIYFIFAPTLCYELSFPRNNRIRFKFLLRRLLELIFIPPLLLLITQQYVNPIINSTRQPISDMDWMKMLERLLKLAVPNHIFWLLLFYWIFHSMLNVFGEILQFADRRFYGDWWNSESIRYFWQNWNVTVHRFAQRHIYKPLRKNYHFSSMGAKGVVFLVSAFFHEYLVSVPLKMLRPWAFLGMLGQVPFALFVDNFLSGTIGNTFVWLSLIIGQPLTLLMYMHDYYIYVKEVEYGKTTLLNEKERLFYLQHNSLLDQSWKFVHNNQTIF
ncbi:hypothetical protein SNEBB_000783 [Seison nebaliae]|nr:hypothetical protein SNEBB_000783 [Seison nebaliae]